MNENKSGAGGVIAVIIAIILIIAMVGSCSGGSGSSSSSKTAKCQSCGRTFKAGDAGGNYKSIARTNMCKNCYNNFKWAQSALGGLAPKSLATSEHCQAHLCNENYTRNILNHPFVMEEWHMPVLLRLT